MNFINTDGSWKDGNTLPIASFNFMLRVEMFWDIPCKSIKVIRKENEYDYIQEGGVNDYVHLIRKPISKPFTFQVERYVGNYTYDPISLGTQLALPVMLSVGRYLNPAMFLPDRQYIFTGCEVTGKEYGELNAERAGLLTETVTIAFSSMFAIDSPVDSMDEYWSFDGKSKAGKGKSHKNTARTIEELSKEDMAKKGHYWSMGKNFGGVDDHPGESYSSRQNLYLKGADEESAEEMAAKGKLWSFDDKNKAGTGTASRQNDAYSPSEPTKEDLAKLGKLWSFDGKKKQGNGTISAQNKKYQIEELTEEQMTKKAKVWPPKQNAKDVAEFLNG